jgi:sodium-dependent dicarboxylate transporter 2/3/5
VFTLTIDKEFKRLILLLCAIGFVVLSFFIAPPAGLSSEGVTMLAITVAAAFLWISEAVPIGVTGLLIIFFEAITNILPLSTGLAYLAHPVNAVVLVGFLLAAILVKSGLDVRIGLMVISKMGERTDRLILGLMIATAFLSMWMSNTATAAIMLPIGIGILNMAEAKPLESNFGKAMVIGIAYAANIGGMGTPTGTPANPVAIALIDSMAGIKLSFLDWMVMVLPVVVTILPLSWLMLIKIHPLEYKTVKGGLSQVNAQLKDMGPITYQQKKVLCFFAFAIIMWLMDSVIPLPDDWLYIVAVFLTLVIVTPKIGFMSWKEAEREISWNILFLCGGGLAMGAGLKKAGVIEWIADLLSGVGSMPEELVLPLILLVVGGVGINIFCTISGTATTFVPLVVGLALSYGWSPVMMGIAACLASSFAFLLPANSAPNALAFGTGYFKTSELFVSGVFQIIISIIVITLILNLLYL